LTDLAEAQDLLRRNIALNGLEGRCFAAELPFGTNVDAALQKIFPSKDLEGLNIGKGRRIDVVIASDCTYSYMAKFTWEPLAHTILSAASCGSSSEKLHSVETAGEERRQSCMPTTELWLAHQERYGANDKAVRPFFDFLAQASEIKSKLDSSCGIPTSSSFVEIKHPQIGEDSQFYSEEYPLRIFHALLPGKSAVS
jgi:hypothetical protein